MKILCLADLHIGETQLQKALIGELTGHLLKIKALSLSENPDVIAVAGDLLPPGKAECISAVWKQIFPAGIPVMTVIGNHDLWYSKFEDVLAKLRCQSADNPDVIFLDIQGSCRIGNVNFVGGMLGFDGSMRYRESQQITPWNSFRDYKIPDIESRYMEINYYYVEKITAGIQTGRSNVLITHHIPHRYLSGHAPNEYSFYSGMRDIVSELPLDAAQEHYLICGHTHSQVITDIAPNIHGINVGNDYDSLKYYSISTLENTINFIN